MKTKRVLGGIALMVVMAVAAFAVVLLPGYREQARIGSAYAARVACSCRYVAGRPLGDCYKDFEPGMSPITLHDDPATRTVTANYPMLGEGSARFEEGWGCRMVLQ